mgnify:FL=1|jgi:hypothetical protein|tara:strand:- start:3499 stop:3774 length:276 start_codon:yes stop_codon:yes gene_type:complete
MAYSNTGLNLIGGGGKAGSAPQVWTYTSADAIATVNTAAYFNNASTLLNVRDIIFVVDSNTPTLHIVSVLSNASGVVDISDGTAIAETDSD